MDIEADFTANAVEKLPLYARGVAAAETHGLRALAIRLSFAEALLNLSRHHEARAQLLACRDEMEVCEDESDRRSWSELMAACERKLD